MTIFIHIPKTGGTSVRYLFQSEFGDKLLTDYSRQWSNADGHKLIIHDKIECIFGHLEHDAFDDIISVSKKITWLRNPCDRIYSYYNHIMTRPDYNNKTTLEVYKSRCNFRDFIQLEWMQNNALNYLKDSKPNDYFFIGITEYFKQKRPRTK